MSQVLLLVVFVLFWFCLFVCLFFNTKHVIRTEILSCACSSKNVYISWISFSWDDVVLQLYIEMFLSSAQESVSVQIIP